MREELDARGHCGVMRRSGRGAEVGGVESSLDGSFEGGAVDESAEELPLLLSQASDGLDVLLRAASQGT